MGKDVFFILKKDAQLTDEQVAMIESARQSPVQTDDENPEIDPLKTPKQYEALMNALRERNRRLTVRPEKTA